MLNEYLKKVALFLLNLVGTATSVHCAYQRAEIATSVAPYLSKSRNCWEGGTVPLKQHSFKQL
jgi:hypothetical protein